MQVAQKLPQRVSFAAEMLSRIENEHDFLNHIIFSDGATLHVGKKSENKHNCRILGSENPHINRKWKETVQKSMCCTPLHGTVIGQFLFVETSLTANFYLDRLQIYAISQMQHLQLTVIFQQDAGARMFEHIAGTGLPAGYPKAY
ncbi:hypothetical protein AVEN_14097-1 [Araneus ventricosus]|uniref:Uncharacterized protein n=1 Tax=Araneus ventricosus TaxID=182803 RepID=A0A4Y2PYF4_ARAVE|nr:hypothetical protein AVEN_14097-1 [Araneus ventricosus]